jgi:hypothetical protein
MSAVQDLVKLGLSVVQAGAVQSALEGTASAADLVRQGFSVNQANAILAAPPVVGELAKHGIWAAVAGLIVAEYERLNAEPEPEPEGEPE